MLRHRANLLLAALVGLAIPSASGAGDAGVAEKTALLDYAGGCAACRTYREHAPLAFFSLGSLAVGGVFYGIGSSLGHDGPVSGNGARMETAVGAAGITALAAAGAYLYYALRGEAGDAGAPSAGASPAPSVSPEAASPSGPTPAGPSAGPGIGIDAGMDAGGGVSATLVFPLSALLD